MQELKKIWETILEKLELSVSNVSFVMWFKPLKVIDLIDGKKLVISANSTSAKNQILRNFMDKLTEVASDVIGENVEIEVLDQKEELAYIEKRLKLPKILLMQNTLLTILLLAKAINLFTLRHTLLLSTQEKNLILYLYMVALVLEKPTCFMPLATI